MERTTTSRYRIEGEELLTRARRVYEAVRDGGAEALTRLEQAEGAKVQTVIYELSEAARTGGYYDIGAHLHLAYMRVLR